MLQKTYFHGIFLSFLLFSPIHASDAEALAAPSEPPSTLPAATTVEVTPTVFSVQYGHFVRSPIRRGLRSHQSISITDCASVGELDPACFQNDPALQSVIFRNSIVSFSAFLGGGFGRNCPKLSSIDLVNSGVDLKSFVEIFASPELLERIASGACILTINRAPDDLKAPKVGAAQAGSTPSHSAALADADGATAAAADSKPPRSASKGANSHLPERSIIRNASAAITAGAALAMERGLLPKETTTPVYTQEEVQTMIKAFKAIATTTTSTTSNVWWLANRLTLGIIPQ